MTSSPVFLSVIDEYIQKFLIPMRSAHTTLEVLHREIIQDGNRLAVEIKFDTKFHARLNRKNRTDFISPQNTTPNIGKLMNTYNNLSNAYIQTQKAGLEFHRLRFAINMDTNIQVAKMKRELAKCEPHLELVRSLL